MYTYCIYFNDKEPNNLIYLKEYKQDTVLETLHEISITITNLKSSKSGLYKECYISHFGHMDPESKNNVMLCYEEPLPIRILRNPSNYKIHFC